MKTYTQLMNEVFNQSGRLKKGTTAFTNARFHRFERAIKAQGTARGRRQVHQSGDPTVVQAKPVSDEKYQRLGDRVREVKDAVSPKTRQKHVRNATDAETLRLTGKSSKRQQHLARPNKPSTHQVTLVSPLSGTDAQNSALAALIRSDALKQTRSLGRSAKLKKKTTIERPALTGDKSKTDLD
jgi:hypothetical protein